MFRRLALAAALLGGPGAAYADPPVTPATPATPTSPSSSQAVATYAIVVGSNTGGPGQTDLHFAEDDARRVATVLTELGGYSPDQVDVVLHPSPAELRERIARLADRVQADVAAGRQARVFFYYSGHARAQAIDLGDDELPLAELRERLFHVPATLTVVVLDACQSGAFSRVKGAAPAADFSYSSRQHLDAAGIAVLASSSGSELSQESEQLRSSYFTHHLLVGLRGAGDANGDGQVTIDEAYRYAYNQTLLATAETAVGGQHVTFEADLKGHGEVPLSFPRAATAAIVLPPALAGKTLVSDRGAHAVVAETYKAKGAAVRIAVAPGDYDVLVRDGDVVEHCEVTAPGQVDLSRCERENVVSERTKGGGWRHPYRLEVGTTIGPERHDGYTDTLDNFGYQENFNTLSATLQVTGLRRVAQYAWVGAQLAHTELPGYQQPIVGADVLHNEFSWNATTFELVGRLATPLGRHVDGYVQGAAGVGLGRSTLDNVEGETNVSTNVGAALAAGAGALFHGPWGVDALVGYEFDYAPIVKDLIGNTHGVGGNRATLSLGYAF